MEEDEFLFIYNRKWLFLFLRKGNGYFFLYANIPYYITPRIQLDGIYSA